MIERNFFNSIPYVIYVPDSFLSRQKLPLLALFRAHPDEWFNSAEDKSRGRRTVFRIIHDMINKGFISPMAFVFPCTCSFNRQEFYFGPDVYAPELKKSPDPFFTHKSFELEFLPFLAKKYNLDIDRVSLDGFSLGGYTSLSYSFLSPGRYLSTGSFDGSILDYAYDNRRIYPETPSDITFDELPYVFGSDPDEDFFRSINPMDLVLHARIPANLFIMASNCHRPESNRPRVQKFLHLLQERGGKNNAPASIISEDSQHEWYWVDEYIYRSIPFHSAILHNQVPKTPDTDKTDKKD